MVHLVLGSIADGLTWESGLPAPGDNSSPCTGSTGCPCRSDRYGGSSWAFSQARKRSPAGSGCAR